MKYVLLSLAIGVLGGCGDAVAPQAEVTAADTASAVPVAAIDLSAHDMPLLLTPPDKQLTGGEEPALVWRDETGSLEVRAGDHFGLMIREEAGDIPRLKASLDREMVKKNTITQETPDRLCYRSEFPDDPSLVFLHFYQVVTVGGRSFVVQDIDGPAFNQQDIERMLAAVSPKQPA